VRRWRPILSPDPGWFFILAGLGLIVAALLVPVHQQTHELRSKVARMENDEQVMRDRLRAYADFLAAIDDGDPTLLRRLVTAQLNQIRAEDEPILLASSIDLPVTDWIEAAVEPRPVVVSDYPRTSLTELVTGTWRQWIIGGSVLCLFVGLLLDGRGGVMSRRRSRAAPAPVTAAPRPDGLDGARESSSCPLDDDSHDDEPAI